MVHLGSDCRVANTQQNSWPLQARVADRSNAPYLPLCTTHCTLHTSHFTLYTGKAHSTLDSAHSTLLCARRTSGLFNSLAEYCGKRWYTYIVWVPIVRGNGTLLSPQTSAFPPTSAEVTNLTRGPGRGEEKVPSYFRFLTPHTDDYKSIMRTQRTALTDPDLVETFLG